MQIITSADNKYLKLGRSLQRRKFRERENRFLLEGKIAVKDALQRHGAAVEAVFVTAAQADWLRAQPDTGFVALQIEDQEMARLCDTQTPQGVVAVVRRPVYELAAVARAGGLLLYLEGISDPGNLGSIMRSALAFAVNALLLSPDTTDAYSPKVIRASMGSVLALPILQQVELAALMELKARGFKVCGSSPTASAALGACDLTGPLVLALGRESTGMSPALTAACDQNIKIPINSAVESLNVAAACAIILAEAFRQRV